MLLLDEIFRWLDQTGEGEAGSLQKTAKEVGNGVGGGEVRNKKDASYSLPTLHVTTRAGKREPLMQWSHFHDLRGYVQK